MTHFNSNYSRIRVTFAIEAQFCEIRSIIEFGLTSVMETGGLFTVPVPLWLETVSRMARGNFGIFACLGVNLLEID